MIAVTTPPVRKATLEDLFENNLDFIVDPEAAAIVAAIKAYCQSKEMMEIKVPIGGEKPLFEILGDAGVPQWMISGVVMDNTLGSYNL